MNKLTKKEFFKKNHFDLIQYFGIAVILLGLFDIIFLGAFGITPIIIGALMVITIRFFGSKSYKDYSSH